MKKEKIILTIIISLSIIYILNWVWHSKFTNYFISEKTSATKKVNENKTVLIKNIKNLDKINLIEERFKNLYKKIDLSTSIGYVTDLNGSYDWVTNFQHAQYTLSPAILDETNYNGLIIGNFTDINVVNKIKKQDYIFCKKKINKNNNSYLTIEDLYKIKNQLVIYSPKLVNTQGYFYKETYDCKKNYKISILEELGNGAVLLKIENLD